MHTLMLLVHGKLVRALEGSAHLHAYIVGDRLFGWAGLEGADGHSHPNIG